MYTRISKFNTLHLTLVPLALIKVFGKIEYYERKLCIFTVRLNSITSCSYLISRSPLTWNGHLAPSPTQPPSPYINQAVAVFVVLLSTIIFCC